MPRATSPILEKDANWYVNNRIRPPKKFFDWCYSQFPMVEFVNKNKKISSNRKNCKVIKKQLRKNTVLEYFDCYRCYVIILCNKEKIEIQSYGFYSSYHKGIQNIEFHLVNFEVLANDKIIQCTYDYFNPSNYVYGLTNQKNFSGGPYTGTIIYQNNFEKQIKEVSELRYLIMDELLNIYRIKHFYKYRFEIEFLQKINSNKMAGDLMYNPYKLDFRIFNKLWLKSHKRILKNADIDFEKFIFEEKVKSRNGKVVPGIDRYLNWKDLSAVPNCVGIIHFQNWVIKNNVNISEYKDYIKMAKYINYKIDGSSACPKNIHIAHQRMVELFNLKLEEERKDEIRKKEENKRKEELALTKSMEKRVETTKKYEMSIGQYLFIVPNKIEDLINEGATLHHCVGSYAKSHADGKTTIIFIRNKKEPEKPLYTMEWKNKELVQIRAKYNADPPKEVFEAVDLWKSKVEKGGHAIG